ncbi:MAG: hypothetical protein K2N13_08680 [Paraprevotella sp.]|nr:hypothetical protein [Paraprevotella sp.]
MPEKASEDSSGESDSVCLPVTDTPVLADSSCDRPSGAGRYLEKRTYAPPRFKNAAGVPLRSRIYSVPSFQECFSDLQDIQIIAARKWGVSPVADRQEAERRKKELVYVGSNPFYTMDEGMTRSIPYLVPQAAELLQRIGRNFLDSLAVKGIPLHTLIVTSVLRTEEDVRKLRRYNVNATERSCHRYGTTFDISYNRYTTVSPPQGPERRAVRNDSLKWVLSEVLRDLRASGHCYVKHEVKQGCYHITVR